MGLLSIILPILPIIYEDFKYRAIHWVWVALFAGIIIIVYPIDWEQSFLNALFMGLQLFLLNIYFSIKNRRWINLFENYLGIGDLVFFLPLCLLFSPVNFILFFIASLSLTLLGYLVYQISFPDNKVQTIPLAGAMAIVLIFVLLVSLYFGIALNQDYWLIAFT